MSNPNPFDGPSPWGESPAKEQKPMSTEIPTVADGPNPFKIGVTLKAGSGFDAPWLTPTVYGDSADETAKRAAALLKAMGDAGLLDLTSQAAGAFVDKHEPFSKPSSSSPKQFVNGRVQPKQAVSAPADDDCTHGRNLVAKANWTAMFCQSDACKPLWKQKDGSFKANI
ncbi:hypothetical protein [Streptomyces sp. NPDC055036]